VQDAGFTFRQGDASDLADRLSFLIANPAVRRAAGEAAKGRIRDNYQWDRISSEVEQVYFNILGLRPSDAGMKKPSGRATIEMGSASGRKAG
jgi:glycosyltransferase involved in cell wall biosynthesis